MRGGGGGGEEITVCTMFVFLAEEDPKYTCKCNLVFFLKERIKGHKKKCLHTTTHQWK